MTRKFWKPLNEANVIHMSGWGSNHSPIEIILDLEGILKDSDTDYEDEDDMEEVTLITNTDELAHEIEDLGYKSEIASDLTALIDKLGGHSPVPNLKKKVLEKMMLMSGSEFLKLMYAVLRESPSAEGRIGGIINQIEDEHEDSDEIEDVEEINYSNVSKREIRSMIDQALDSGDYQEAKELISYLDRSKWQEMHKKVTFHESYHENRRK